MAEPIIEFGSNYEIDEDTNGDLVIRHITNGVVLKYDASADTTTIPDFSGGGGGGIWPEDGNSPQTATGTSSNTYTLDGTYDRVLVHLQVERASTNAAIMDLRANGDTGANYTHIASDGTRTTGANEVGTLFSVDGNDFKSRAIEVDGRFGAFWRGGAQPPDGNSNNAVGWHNGNLTSPLDSLTLIASRTIDVTWEVFGRDIGTAGEP